MKRQTTDHSFRETLAPAMVLPRSVYRQQTDNSELLRPLLYALIVTVILLLSYALIRSIQPTPLRSAVDLSTPTITQTEGQARLIVQSPNQDQYLQGTQSPADLQPAGGQNLQQTDSYEPLQQSQSAYTLQGSAGTAAAR